MLLKKVRKLSLLCAGIFITVSLSACSNSGGSTDDKKIVGVSMPTKSMQRWIQDGDNMKKSLEEKGYEVDLQYAEDKVENQVSQIENMITKGVDVLVIASIDGSALTDVIDTAADNDIKVIAYDRLIMNTENVSYYATFDNFKVGQIQANYIVDKLDLKNQPGPFNIELFGGSPDDNNAYYFYDGAMSVLDEYIDSGKLVVKSGQKGMDKVSILRWDSATAQSRMDNILSSSYSNEKVYAVLSPNDQIAIGVASSLKSIGYGSGDKAFPIITGQDCDIASMKSIIAGEQTQTIFKDTRLLAEATIDMVDAVLNGKEAKVTDTETYDNGKKVVPSFLCDPVSVDKDNYKEVLIDSGYYKDDQLK